MEDDQPATKSNLSDVKKFASIEHDACVASLRTYLAQDNLAYIIRDTNPPSTFADEHERRLFSLRYDTPEGKAANNC